MLFEIQYLIKIASTYARVELECKAQPNNYFASVVLKHLSWTEFRARAGENHEVMCKTEILHEDSPVVLLHDDKPLTMKELSVDKVYDFDFKYGQKSAVDFHKDLAAIDLSMMQNPKGTRRRRIKRRKYPKLSFVPSLEDIKENELFELSFEDEKKDLAAIHRERALSCGLAVKEEGRRHRHKRHSRSSSGRV